MHTHTTREDVRKDVLWQHVDTVRGYERARPAIPFEHEEFDIVCRVLKAHDVEPQTLLDLGSGDGIATAALMDRMLVRRAVLVDFSKPMLDAARTRFDGTDRHVEIIEGDLYDPGWRTGLPGGITFDVVISRHAIHHLPNDRKRALYREVFDLLSPGGMFVNIEHVSSRAPGYQRAFDQMLVEAIHERAGDGRTLDEVIEAYRTRMDGELNILADVWEQANWLESIGFTNVDVPFKALELAVFCGTRPATPA